MGLLRLCGLASLVALSAATGCSSDSDVKDAGSDGPMDTGSEASPPDGTTTDGMTADGGTDGQTDGTGDAPADTPVDTPMDTPVIVEAGTDIPPDAPIPATLTAEVLDRRQTSFQLRWPAPAAGGGGAVASYDIRVAKVGITSANFDDPAVTRVVPWTGTPAAPGAAQAVVASGLNIEQPYYFAVAGKDAGGTRGTILATGTPVQATFLTTTLSGTGTDGIGLDIDGSGDFGGAGRAFAADGYSDLIVGNTGGTRVYVYFGSASGYSTTPSITITGTLVNFGQAVVNAGDLDGDNLDDIAIASPGDGNGRVFIFSRKNPPASWGTTNSWPAALTEAQANYTLTADATFAGGANSIFRRAMTRLGNFDGTGTSDLAIGFRLRNAMVGGVVIVKGSATFASRTIPDAAGSTIQIDGMVASGQLGISVVGIGQFFAGAGPALVVSAPMASAAYAFRGQAPAAALTTANADDSVVNTPTTEQYGINLGFLGPLGGSPGALTIASTMGKYVDVHLGTAASGPFLGAAGGAPSATVRLVNALSGNSFGLINLGGGIEGTSNVVSFIGGDNVPDLIVAGQSEADVPLYIVNGAAIPAMSGMVDVSAAQSAVVPSVVKVAGRLPTGFTAFATAAAIVDSNRDGYADFAVGESAFNAAGRVVVFY
jgi:hypothetical protein